MELLIAKEEMSLLELMFDIFARYPSRQCTLVPLIIRSFGSILAANAANSDHRYYYLLYDSHRILIAMTHLNLCS